jgi:hypothetical protein
MLTITNAAWELLTKIQSTQPGLNAMRLAEVDGRIKCLRGTLESSDRVIEQAGCPNVLLTPVVAKRLAQRTLDVKPASAKKTRTRFRLISQP